MRTEDRNGQAGWMDGRKQPVVEGTVFTDEELMMLSCGLLSMERGIERALKLVGYDIDVHCTALKAMKKYQKLNAKVCGMVNRSCN